MDYTAVYYKMSIANNPTADLLTLKTIEFEINLYIKSYETGHVTYIQHVRNKEYDEASKTLSELNKISNTLVSLVTSGQTILTKAMSDGTIDQKTVTIKQPMFNKLSLQLRSQQERIKKEEEKIANLDGELETSEQTKQSDYLQYIIIFIVGIIVVGLTTKTVLTQDDTSLDTVILVIIIGLSIYFLIKKFLI